MVEFVYEPYKKVVIHEIVQYDLQTLIHLHGLGIQAGQLGRPINWANGIAFGQRTLPPTEEVVKEQIQGKVHWSFLAFAYMSTHQPIITIPEGNIRIPVVDLSDNSLFRELAEWLKMMYKAR